MDGWRYLSDLDKCTCCGLWIVHWHRRWDNLHNPSGSSIGGASDGVAQHLPSQEPYPVTQLFSRGKSHGDFPTFPLKLSMFPPHWWRWDCWKQFPRWGGSASGWLPRWLFLAVHPCSPLKPVGWRPIIEGFWKVGDPEFPLREFYPIFVPEPIGYFSTRTMGLPGNRCPKSGDESSCSPFVNALNCIFFGVGCPPYTQIICSFVHWSNPQWLDA